MSLAGGRISMGINITVITAAAVSSTTTTLLSTSSQLHLILAALLWIALKYILLTSNWSKAHETRESL